MTDFFTVTCPLWVRVGGFEPPSIPQLSLRTLEVSTPPLQLKFHDIPISLRPYRSAHDFLAVGAFSRTTQVII